MRKLRKTLAIMFSLMALTSTLSSCFNNSDDDSITDAQMNQCIANMAGNYSGDLITGVIQNSMLIEQDTLTNQKSTSDDSKITLINIPASQLAKGITDLTIKQAVAESDETISIQAYYYGFSSVSSTYQFTLAPQSITLNVDYNGGTHVLTFPFYQGGYSYGAGDSQNLAIQLVIAGMYEDNVATSYFTEFAFAYLGKKG